MKLVICLDDKKGMLFNNRRQSRDKLVLEDVFRLCEKVYITPFSQKLFAEYTDKVVVTEDVKSLDDNSFFFAEDYDINSLENGLSQIIVYNWNRVYPADVCCTIDFNSFTLVEETEFAGNSHDKITRQIFVKR